MELINLGNHMDNCTKSTKSTNQLSTVHTYAEKFLHAFQAFGLDCVPQKIFFLFLNQNICCAYVQTDLKLYTYHTVGKLMSRLICFCENCKISKLGILVIKHFSQF